MEKTKCALKILCLLSLCDRDINEREIKIIEDFLESSSLHLSFKASEFINQLRFLTPADQLEVFKSAALTFEQLSDVKQQLDLLRFAIELIYADHQLKPEEQALIEALAHWWNIHLPTFFESELSTVA